MNKGGRMAPENIDWFNGGLFDDDSTLLLDAADLDPSLKKLFFKPKHIFRCYYLPPGESEWKIGHFMYSDSKLFFAPTLSELANDISNYEYF